MNTTTLGKVVPLAMIFIFSPLSCASQKIPHNERDSVDDIISLMWYSCVHWISAIESIYIPVFSQHGDLVHSMFYDELYTLIQLKVQ